MLRKLTVPIAMMLLLGWSATAQAAEDMVKYKFNAKVKVNVNNTAGTETKVVEINGGLGMIKLKFPPGGHMAGMDVAAQRLTPDPGAGDFPNLSTSATLMTPPSGGGPYDTLNVKLNHSFMNLGVNGMLLSNGMLSLAGTSGWVGTLTCMGASCKNKFGFSSMKTKMLPLGVNYMIDWEIAGADSNVKEMWTKTFPPKTFMTSAPPTTPTTTTTHSASLVFTGQEVGVLPALDRPTGNVGLIVALGAAGALLATWWRRRTTA